MAKRSSGATRAIESLAKLDVAFAVRSYVHDPSERHFGEEAAHRLGVSAERVFKTLFTEVDGAYTVALVPVAGSLNLKALAAACGGKRASLVEASVAERKTGYVVGGVSPLGQRAQFPTVIDASAKNHATVLVSAGQRGMEIELDPHDLAHTTNATWALIARTP